MKKMLKLEVDYQRNLRSKLNKNLIPLGYKPYREDRQARTHTNYSLTLYLSISNTRLDAMED